MISGSAGPRDWFRQANCFTADARQIRTWVDDQGRPQPIQLFRDPDHGWRIVAMIWDNKR